MEAASLSQSKPSSRTLARLAPAASLGLALAAGLGLRLWMLQHFFEVNGDALIYGGLAKNLLLHGRYALTTPGGETYPTLIRLPGYPLFLAACFRLFGMENYASAAFVQIALELAGCLLLADFARRIAGPVLGAGAAHATLWLAVLCPFTAIYAANPLTEAPTLFVLALALWSVARFRARPGWHLALCFTFAGAFAAGFGGGAFFWSVAALARQAVPSSPARISAAEPYFMALRRNCIVIGSSFLLVARAPSRMRERFTQRCSLFHS